VLPANFKGCYKSGKVFLQPGEIKRSILYESKTLDMHDLLCLIRIDETGSINSQLKTKMGKVELYALEQQIAFGSAPVSVVWEVDKDCSVMLTSKRTPVTQRYNYATVTS